MSHRLGRVKTQILWRDLTTHLVVSLLEFMQQRAGPVPPPTTAAASDCFYEDSFVKPLVYRGVHGWYVMGLVQRRVG